jgi:small lipoprotein (TIGR04454 family)
MRFVLVLVLAGCGSKAVENGDCSDAVAHAQSVSEKAMPNGLDPKMADRMKATMAAATKAMTDACTADKWSPDALACLKAASTNEDLAKCQKLLTPEQSANVTKAVNQAASAIKPK